MNEADKYIVKMLTELKKTFGQNRNYSTETIHNKIDDIIRRHK